MVGWIAYLDQLAKSPNGLDGRRVSSTFGLACDGRVHQYVPCTGFAWGNGLIQNFEWPLYAKLGRRPDTGNVNGNVGTVSIEHEGSGRAASGIVPYSPDHPWPEPMVEASAKLHEWLFTEGVVAGEPRAGWTISDHRDLAPRAKPFDPGAEWDRAVRPVIVKRVQAALHAHAEEALAAPAVAERVAGALAAASPEPPPDWNALRDDLAEIGQLANRVSRALP